METASDNEIVSGYACGGPGEPCDREDRPYFRPYNLVTRGQLSKIAVAAAEWEVIDPPNPTFSDVPRGHTFYKSAETAYCHGIIAGYTCGGPGEPCPGLCFRPASTATRGQIAKIVYLALQDEPACGLETSKR